MTPGERIVKNPLRHTQRRPLNMTRADDLVLRLRDARARVRLGLSLVEELDVLLDEAAEELESAADIASVVEVRQRNWPGGELVWVPDEHLYDVLEMVGDEDEEEERYRPIRRTPQATEKDK